MEGSGLRTQRELGCIYSLRCSSFLVEPIFHFGHYKVTLHGDNRQGSNPKAQMRQGDVGCEVEGGGRNRPTGLEKGLALLGLVFRK